MSHLWPIFQRQIRGEEPTPYQLPIPLDPALALAGGPYEPTSSPPFRTLDITVHGIEGDLALLTADYRGEKATFYVLDWFCRSDIFLGVAMREILNAARRRRDHPGNWFHEDEG